MKGGFKSVVNFHSLLKNEIITHGDTLFFKAKKIDKSSIKIPLKLHKEGIIEYRKRFFSDNEGIFILPIIENNINIPDYLNYEDENVSIVKKSKKLFSYMKIIEDIIYKSSDRKSAHKFIYDIKTNKSLWYKSPVGDHLCDLMESAFLNP